MVREPGVNILQAAIVEIYEIIRRICEDHNIIFCASWGTALGAVRHNDFIPWDDDLDIEMLRCEYEKFKAVAAKELPAWLRFMSWDNTYSYTNMFAKVICIDKQRVESIEEESGFELTQGLFVDVFVVDRFPKRMWRQLARIVARLLIKFQEYALCEDAALPKVKKLLGLIVGKPLNYFDKGARSCFALLSKDDRIVSTCPKNDSAVSWLSCWPSNDLGVARGLMGMPEECYNKPKWVKFGKTKMPVVGNVEEYLRQCYGNWQELPPPEKRIPSHANKTMRMPWRLGFANVGRRPLLSIVIANYNYGRFIGDAISSVIKQTIGIAKGDNGQIVLMLADGECVELIVCDGGSSDDSVGIIQSYAEWITWWCSEKDKGQSDAFNKGFAHSRGRYLTWLNSDDLLVMGALDRFSAAVKRTPDCQWFAGGCIWMDAELNLVSVHHARRFSKYVANCGTIPVYSPSSFFTKELLDSVGGVNVEYHYKMDRLLWSQFYYDKGVEYCNLKGIYFGLRMHPASKVSGVEYYGRDKMGEVTPELRRNKEERELIARKYPRKEIKKLPQIFALDAYIKLIDIIETIVLKGCRYADICKRFR